MPAPIAIDRSPATSAPTELTSASPQPTDATAKTDSVVTQTVPNEMRTVPPETRAQPNPRRSKFKASQLSQGSDAIRWSARARATNHRPTSPRRRVIECRSWLRTVPCRHSRSACSARILLTLGQGAAGTPHRPTLSAAGPSASFAQLACQLPMPPRSAVGSGHSSEGSSFTVHMPLVKLKVAAS